MSEIDSTQVPYGTRDGEISFDENILKNLEKRVSQTLKKYDKLTLAPKFLEGEAKIIENYFKDKGYDVKLSQINGNRRYDIHLQKNKNKNA